MSKRLDSQDTVELKSKSGVASKVMTQEELTQTAEHLVQTKVGYFLEGSEIIPQRTRFVA